MVKGARYVKSSGTSLRRELVKKIPAGALSGPWHVPSMGAAGPALGQALRGGSDQTFPAKGSPVTSHRGVTTK